jgi:hypothetical protein
VYAPAPNTAMKVNPPAIATFQFAESGGRRTKSAAWLSLD